jgi:hypothetical protein
MHDIDREGPHLNFSISLLLGAGIGGANEALIAVQGEHQIPEGVADLPKLSLVDYCWSISTD